MNGLPGFPALCFVCLIETTLSVSVAFLHSGNNLHEYRSLLQKHRPPHADMRSSIFSRNSLHPFERPDGVGYSEYDVRLKMTETSTAVARTQDKYAASSLRTSIDGAKEGIKTTFRKRKEDVRPHLTQAYLEEGAQLDSDHFTLSSNICTAEPGIGAIRKLCEEATSKGMDLR